MKIFSSGSCRLLASMNDGYGMVTPIHSMFRNFIGINFLGKLHNTKQHIQFIKYVRDEIVIPDFILPKFLTSYNNYHYTCGRKCEDLSLLPYKKETIRTQLEECEWCIFEISSIKLYKKDGYEVFIEHTDDYECLNQTPDELTQDLYKIKEMLPGKKILFQTHFRPQIINNGTIILNREIIYNTVKDFCDNKTTFLYDPSLLLKDNPALYDGNNHFKQPGHKASFDYMYDKFLR
jgi:hypothetical protein